MSITELRLNNPIDMRTTGNVVAGPGLVMTTTDGETIVVSLDRARLGNLMMRLARESAGFVCRSQADLVDRYLDELERPVP